MFGGFDMRGTGSQWRNCARQKRRARIKCQKYNSDFAVSPTVFETSYRSQKFIRNSRWVRESSAKQTATGGTNKSTNQQITLIQAPGAQQHPIIPSSDLVLTNKNRNNEIYSDPQDFHCPLLKTFLDTMLSNLSFTTASTQIMKSILGRAGCGLFLEGSVLIRGLILE